MSVSNCKLSRQMKKTMNQERRIRKQVKNAYMMIGGDLSTKPSKKARRSTPAGTPGGNKDMKTIQ